jgi:hypothetical protein
MTIPLMIARVVAGLARAERIQPSHHQVAVTSSAISSIGYDEDTKVLEVTFRSGSSYTFGGVPKSVFDDFVGAGSKGAYFNANIKDNY